MYKQLIVTIIIFLSAACSAPIRDITREQPTQQSTPLLTLSSSTPTEGQVVSDLSPSTITPPIIQYCPPEREVLFEELNISPSTILLLNRFENDYPLDLWVISKDEPIPTRIPSIPPTYLNLLNFAASPNQQWFAYILIDDQAGRNLWISSMDGTKQIQILANFDGYPRWVDDEVIEVWEYFGQGQCPQYILGINPFTLETMDSPQKPYTDKPHCFFPDLTSPDRTMYVHRDSQLTLYNYNNGQQTRIFPWLPDDWAKGDAGNSARFFWTENGFTIILPKENFLEYVLNLPATSATEAKNPLAAIQLPYKIYGHSTPWESPHLGLVAIDLTVEQTQVDSEPPTPSRFYILDLLNIELRDYCFDRSDAKLERGVTSSLMSSSLDGAYLAWTIHEPPGVGPPLETVVLEIMTGRIARIEGFQFLGWGEIPE